MEGKQLWGYDKNLDKYTMSEMIKGMDNALYVPGSHQKISAQWFFIVIFLIPIMHH